VRLPPEPGEVPKLPEKRQRSILKANFEKMKRDADELVKLAKALQEELNKSNENILSLDMVDKADRIEKLAKKFKGDARSY
jgi:type IV secretory pathway VirB4 component